MFRFSIGIQAVCLRDYKIFGFHWVIDRHCFCISGFCLDQNQLLFCISMNRCLSLFGNSHETDNQTVISGRIRSHFIPADNTTPEYPSHISLPNEEISVFFFSKTFTRINLWLLKVLIYRIVATRRCSLDYNHVIETISHEMNLYASYLLIRTCENLFLKINKLPIFFITLPTRTTQLPSNGNDEKLKFRGYTDSFVEV